MCVCRAQSSLWDTGKCFCRRVFPSASQHEARGCAKVESRVLQGTEGRAASMLPVCPHVKPQCNLMLIFSTSSILSLF